jgi:hypothetical protein
MDKGQREDEEGYDDQGRAEFQHRDSPPLKASFEPSGVGSKTT